ncbi:MAG: hypothetical protein F4045_03645 [Chloroflexi bacterium]|nr:hypothetical protein [Chloroflexota bacterium]MYK34213.1 hypothetical protein [Chloroflexota bacterium]
MLAFSNCPKCSTKNVEIVPDGAAHRDYAAKCDHCGLLYQVQGSNPQSSEIAFRIGTVEVRWLPRVEGDAAGLMQRFTRAFDYEDGFGRLMLTKSSCFEMLDEYVRERGVRHEPLADWLNSLPWEMEGDGDAGLDLHVVWEEGGVLSLSDPESQAHAQFGEVLRRGG